MFADICFEATFGKWSIPKDLLLFNVLKIAKSLLYDVK